MQSYQQDVRRLSNALVSERDRQKAKLQQRLQQRQALLEKEAKAASHLVKLQRSESQRVRADRTLECVSVYLAGR